MILLVLVPTANATTAHVGATSQQDILLVIRLHISCSCPVLRPSQVFASISTPAGSGTGCVRLSCCSLSALGTRVTHGQHDSDQVSTASAVQAACNLSKAACQRGAQ